MRKIDTILIHCADTPDDSPHIFTVSDIDRWHRERGFRRASSARAKFNPSLASVGYHYIILRDGRVQTGRAEEEIGAHAVGHNSTSLGVCLIGQRKFTTAQWNALKEIILTLTKKYPGAHILGHYQVDTAGKTCPNFDVPRYVGADYTPVESSVAIV